jgi:hypothetical protein
MNGFLTGDSNRTGGAGTTIDIGKGKEPGASGAINLDRNDKDRSYNVEGKSNINRGLRFSDISSRCKNIKGNSNKDNPGFRSLRDSRNPGNSSNLGTSNARRNRNTRSLKEDLKEGMQDREGRRTRSVKTLPSTISVGSQMGTAAIY